MRRLIGFGAVLVALFGLMAPAPASALHTRVIVSSTLDGTLHVFDATTFEETQPPLPAKGTSPVRLWVQPFGGRTYLLSANHGIQGSVGAYDLDGDLLTELPLSPFPSGGQGSVGITAGYLDGVALEPAPIVLVTNTVQALGGCGLPEGSVTVFDAGLLNSAGVLRQTATISSGGSIPYAIAFDGGRAYASNNCNKSLAEIEVGASGLTVYGTTPVWNLTLEQTGTGITGAGPDAVMFDPAYGATYVNNIGGNSVSVFSGDLAVAGTPARTTVPLPGAGPIDATLADSAGGARWLITSNGSDDTVSIIDRAAIQTCLTSAIATCDAEVARIPAGVEDGAPEGVSYDPTTNRVFVVNKTLGDPALSVIQLDAGGTGRHIATIPLRMLGGGTPLPDLIAFDVVVQTR